MALSDEMRKRILLIATDPRMAVNSFVEIFALLFEKLDPIIPTSRSNAFVVPRFPGRLAVSREFAKNIDPKAFADYLAYTRHFDPGLAFGLANPGKAHRLSDLLPNKRFGHDPYTSQVRQEMGTRFVLGMSMPMPQNHILALGFHSDVVRGDFTDAQVRLLNVVAPVLAQTAFRSVVNDKVVEARAREQSGEVGRVGVVELDSAGRIRSSDRAATCMLREIDPEFAGADDWLLRHAQTEVRSARLAAQTRIHLTTSGRWIRVTFSLAPSADGRVLVLLEELAPGSLDFMDAEMQRIGLTPREREIAALAVQGAKVPDMAALLGVTAATARLHLAHIYKKAGSDGRVMLAARLLHGEPSVTPALPASSVVDRLTTREREVLSLVLAGRGNREIAFQLGLSPVTVKLHLRRIYRKTGTKNRASLSARLLGSFNQRG